MRLRERGSSGKNLRGAMLFDELSTARTVVGVTINHHGFEQCSSWKNTYISSSRGWWCSVLTYLVEGSSRSRDGGGAVVSD